ncbi:helix-turn-helix transcriptional regulator [Arhodomonas sp. AD133]|uniref:helix-turn-helix transcriptional regulator n=1 Tax=Arhodomonas sp. AD133 TaxID=3415009 RepID=UPI003EBA0073
MSKILYLRDVADELGMTEAAVRSHLQRGSDAVPKPSRLGGRLVWGRKQFDAWLEAKLEGPPRRRRGRPRKTA